MLSRPLQRLRFLGRVGRSRSEADEGSLEIGQLPTRKHSHLPNLNRHEPQYREGDARIGQDQSSSWCTYFQAECVGVGTHSELQLHTIKKHEA